MNLTNKDRVAYNRLVGQLKKVLDAGPVMDGTLSAIALGGSTRYQLTRKEDGRTRTVYVPGAAAETVTDWTNRWKEVRTILRQLGEFTRNILPTLLVRPAPVKKAEPKKAKKTTTPPPKKSPLQKNVGKKAETKKTVAKKVEPKKPVVKQIAARKSVAKKAPVKKGKCR